MTYLLIVYALECGIPCPPLWEDPRPLLFTECRTRRMQEMLFYETLRDTRVWVICQKQP